MAGRDGRDILVVYAGGGTGGHVVPSLAVASVMQQRGHEALFIGTRRGMEARLAPQAGFPIEWIEIGGLNRVGLAQKVKTLWALPLSVWRSWRILGRTRPAAVFSMGGYVAAPVMLAALLRSVPVVVMEPNALPGLVARKMARFVRRALVAFEEARRFFPPGRSEVCGLPVRKEFFEVGERAPGDVFTVLLTGGSRGARALNEAARECWPLLKPALEDLACGGATIPRLRWVHQSGADDYPALRAAFAETGLDGEVAPFFNGMAAQYADADLIVSRSGAGAVAEIAAAGRPSILVPFPFAADDHQKHNAQAFERAGAALLIEQSALSGPVLCEAIVDLMKTPERLRTMGGRARTLAHRGAALRAADVLEEVAAR